MKIYGKYVRVRIEAVTDESGKLLRFSGSGLPGQTFTDREMFQHYGFVSKPLNGAEGITIIQSGRNVLIAEDDRRYRISVQDGEVALYSDKGVKVHLMRNKIVEISGADEINLGGDRASLEKLIDARFKTLFDNHAHVGVVAGSSSSGPPVVPLDLAACATDTVRGK
jgi:hypothetical protein